MQEFFTELGFSSNIFAFVILPLLIFMARVADVSIGTMRVILVMQGKKGIAPILGFFESLIWLLAIGQIFKHIDNPVSYISYATGYAFGTYIGIIVEEKMAIGRVVVRVITSLPAHDLIEYLERRNHRYSNIEGTGNDGKVNIIFTVVKRNVLKELIPKIHEYNPKAFFTIEGVKKVSDEEVSFKENKGILIGKMLDIRSK
ncbi:DUF2179 domain-containing protein [Marivirga sp.]|uniref:DUF2179 domain-containing protein n=1 Tax=Marivirga sp. TaxID=2018662 RepID=UPI002D7F2772|nr:DUF2179 domain-containing protein [Marivirga sp.]HET8859808.1 DUF2179 domain-containing protein [Marivirga sp.]